MASSSPLLSADSAPAVPELHRLNAVSSGQQVALVRLTDDMIAALQKANGAGAKISIKKEGGVITLSGDKQFRFSIQSMASTPSDVMRLDKRHGYQMLGTIHQKYQIKATEQSLDETRHRAKLMAEQEAQRTAKEVPKHQTKILAQKAQQMSQQRLPFERSKYASTSSAAKHSPISNNKPKVPVPLPSTASTLTASQRPNMSQSLKNDLIRKKPRQRVIHLIVTGRYSSTREVFEKLQKDGLEKETNYEDIRNIVKEISESEGTGPLTLRQNLFSEVDMRWPWFTTEEKANIRRAQQPASSSSGFAPTRKTGIDRIQHRPPSGDSSRKENSSPSTAANPSPPLRTTPQPPIMVQGKKVSPQMARTMQETLNAGRKTVSPASSTSSTMSKASPGSSSSLKGSSPIKSSPASTNSSIDLLDSLLPSTTVKRKAHEPPTAPREKRPFIMSNTDISPPIPQRPPQHRPVARKDLDNEQERQRAIAASGGSTGGSSVSSASSGSSSRLSSPIIPSTIQPSQDWAKEFPEAKSKEDADNYHQMFHKEYPAYMKTYKQLEAVSQEFRELSDRYERAKRGIGDDVEEVERSIHGRYYRYQKDAEFVRLRQEHADHQAKLEIIKQRIAAFQNGRRNDNHLSASLSSIF